MKKALVISLSLEELQDLYRIMLDRDEPAAWAFLDQHLKEPVRQALEGG